MISLRESDNALLVDFDDYESYEAFDEIVVKLKQLFKVTIEEELDGPESRVWKLSIDKHPFSLHNNPYGNYLKASTEDSKKKLNALLPKLKEGF